MEINQVELVIAMGKDFSCKVCNGYEVIHILFRYHSVSTDLKGHPRGYFNW